MRAFSALFEKSVSFFVFNSITYAYVIYLDVKLLQKFRKEDMQLSGTEAFMRRSNSLQRVSKYMIFQIISEFFEH